MKRTILTAALFLTVASCAVRWCAAQTYAQPNITTTTSETLWTGRFAHCDYGFYVLLPEGMVAHANRPPNPLHGFTVGLPDIDTRKEVSFERKRFIWMNAEYDASDSESPEGSIASYIDSLGGGEPGRRVVEKRHVKLGTLSAIRIKVEYDSPTGKVVEEKLVALRRNIVYEIGMRTTERDYNQDKEQFERVVKGFRVWRIHYC